MFNDALRLTKMDIGVIPTFDGKKYDMRGLRARGYTVADLKTQLPNEADLKHWFGHPIARRGMAIVCTDVACLDFDTEAAYDHFRANYPTFSYTWTVRTKRGYHLYYQVENRIDRPVKVTLTDVELKHNGAVVATGGPGYQTVSNGLLNDYTMLKIRDVFTLPIVGPVEKSEKKTFFSTKSPPPSSDNPIDQIKSSIPISSYLEALGYDLIPHGKTHSMKCPFHEDGNPSFWIMDGKQICNCHTCGDRRPMDILNLHQRLNNCDINRAVYDLAGWVQ